MKWMKDEFDSIKLQKMKGKNYMKKIKVILATVLSAVVVMGSVIPVCAQDAKVDIEIEATDMNVSVTVPSTLPIVFNADGTNTFPTNWSIENKSAIAGIHLTQIDMNAGATPWKLAAASEDVKNFSVDTKSIQFSIGKAEVMKLVEPTGGTQSKTGTATFESSDISIPSGGKQELSFHVVRGAFSQNEASAKAFDMVLTFAFN